MGVDIPPQRHRCPAYEWCVERREGHSVHVGEVHVLTTSRGIEIRVLLSATEAHAPVVQIEAALEKGGPLMELTELDAAEAVELAGFLLRLARVAQGSGEGVR
jgi:hypothetical protein